VIEFKYVSKVFQREFGPVHFTIG